MNDFIKISLPFESNLYSLLFSSIHFEKTGKGRLGNHLVKIENKSIPIVRTTTQYSTPAQIFLPIHEEIIERLNRTIQNDTSLNLPHVEFNNALIEVYDKTYTKMNFHSDQGLDLDNDSYIGLFSCYENPVTLTEQHLRKLIVQEKNNNKVSEILLTHNSVILFSVKSNARFLHKIIANSNFVNLRTDNKWLGITFRKSKTLIHFKDNLPYFEEGNLLVLAGEEQKREFFKLRGQENREIDFVYPQLNFTISMSDTLVPCNHKL